MRYVVISLVTAVLLFAGCHYDSPLTTEHIIPIDLSVLGLWEELPDEEDSDIDEAVLKLTILRYSDTEYLIRFFDDDGGLYYRGYPIKVGGISCVQLQIIGEDDGTLDQDEENIFQVAYFQLVNNKMKVKLLNTNLIDTDLKGSKALMSAFLKHKNNKELFDYLGRFRKVESETDQSDAP